jgi:hypothetical protein
LNMHLINRKIQYIKNNNFEHFYWFIDLES